MKTRTLLIVLTMAVTASSATSRPGESAGCLPNIILYLADDQMKEDYGCYGNPHVHTPAVDRLAREGIRLNRAYTLQAICAPSRSTLYTGNFPLRNGCFLNHVPLREGEESLIDDLQAIGFRVILAGKSHVAPDDAFPWDAHWEEESISLQDGGQAARLPMDRITDHIRTSQSPYFLVVASSLPHTPYPDLSPLEPDSVVDRPYHSPVSEKWLRRQAGYYENIRRDNAQLEQVLKAVDDAGAAGNTLFIYAADHGSVGKFTVYDSGLNIPLVIRWPERIKAGIESDALLTLTDLIPTIMGAIGKTPPADIDGRSFPGILFGTSETARDYAYGIAEYQNIWIPRIAPSRMVTDGRWKYIRNVNAWERHQENFGSNEAVNAFIRLGAAFDKSIPFEELYDLKQDPYEEDNLADQPAYADILARLSAELERWMSSQDDYLSREGPLPVFETTHSRIDEPNRLYSPPTELINSLKDSDFIQR